MHSGAGRLLKEVTGYQDEIVNDISKPDGTPRKLLDVGRLRAPGWRARIRPARRHQQNLSLVPEQPIASVLSETSHAPSNASGFGLQLPPPDRRNRLEKYA